MNSAICRSASIRFRSSSAPSTTRSDQRQRELPSDHGERLQQLFLIGRQPIDARGQDALHGGRNLQLRRGTWSSFTVVPLRTSAPSSNSTCTISSMKNGVPSVFSMISRLSGSRSDAVAEQRGEHLLGALLAERVEPQLGVIGLAIPLMRILGPVVHQQQNLRGRRSNRPADSATPGSASSIQCRSSKITISG